ncbi:MAG: TonB-dependent receptor plug domain-containing protein [Agriterribacter sp.]
MKKKLLFTLSCFLCICIAANAQVSVSGKVTDAGGNAMQGVTVAVKGTNINTVTSENGMFTLNNIPSSNSVLVFSFVGFATRETVVGNRTNLNISLTEVQSSIDTLVIIGYGTARKKDYTGSVTQVNSKIISTQANSTVTRALEGVVPGIQVSSIDGQPGLDMGIRLRGAGSTAQNNANALIVIDGVPTEYANALSSINPKDIQSISVLKDAASTAVYGARGANGVLLITTKKGSKGRSNISFETRMGYNYLGTMKYDRIDDAKDFYEHAWRVIYNSVRYGANGTGTLDKTNYTTNVQNPNMSHEDAAAFASAHLFDYKGTGTTTDQLGRNLLGNWMLYDVPGAVYTTTGVSDPTIGSATASATMSGAYLVNPDGKLNPNAKQLYPSGSYEDYFFERMFRQEHNLSASGGNDKMDYFVSLGMLEDPSYIRGSKFKRYNVRSNINAQLTNWLKVGANMGYSYRNTQSPATRYGRNPGTVQQNVFRWTNGQSPLIPLFARDKDGNIMKNADGTDRVNDNSNITYTPLGQQPQFPNGTTGAPLYSTNLIQLLDKDIDRRTSHDLNMKGYATITFLKEFSFTTNLSYDRFSEVRLRYGNRETGAVKDVGALASIIPIRMCLIHSN